jgi:hypothetical protein
MHAASGRAGLREAVVSCSAWPSLLDLANSARDWRDPRTKLELSVVEARPMVSRVRPQRWRAAAVALIHEPLKPHLNAASEDCTGRASTRQRLSCQHPVERSSSRALNPQEFEDRSCSGCAARCFARGTLTQPWRLPVHRHGALFRAMRVTQSLFLMVGCLCLSAPASMSASGQCRPPPR